MPISDVPVMPFLSWGMWVALCPRGCGNAEKFGRCDDGSCGGLNFDRFACRRSHGGCGFACRVEWPENIEDIEALALARPVPSTRNWRPGETLSDLLFENMTHGLAPTHELAIAGGHLILGREIPLELEA